MANNKTEKQIENLVNEYTVVEDKRAVKIHVQRDLSEYRNVVEREPRRMREDPVAFMLNIGLYYQGAGWRGYKDYIGTKILYPEFTREMRSMVLNSPKVQEVIDQLADRQTQRLVEQKTWKPSRIQKQRKAFQNELEVVAKSIVEKAVATVDSMRILRFFAFVVNTILVRLYHQGLHIRENEWVELKRVALIAQEKKESLIFLPSHKSHIDYLVVSYLMFRLGIQIPHIIAGDNLDLPVVGKILKSSGAVWIRREWGGDELYKTILEEYMIALLSNGFNLECFVEGTRSRLGKLLQPKLGVVKIILDALVDNRVTNCHIVPISIGYDKIIETSSYATELLGTPKQKESVWQILTSSRLLQLKWGRVDVRLGKPFALRDWLDDQLRMRGQMDLKDLNQKSILLKSLGYRVLADINSIAVVMPSALVGTVILTLRGRGVGRSELIRRVDWLRKVIQDKGGHVSEFYGMSTGSIVDRTVSIHKDLIGERKGKDIVEPTFYPISPFELSYYRNQVIHLFVEEAIVCAALYSVIKKGGGKPLQRMKYNDLFSEISFLSSLLKLDMIYRPGGVEKNTRRTVQWLMDQNVIEMTEDGWVGLNDMERQCGRENYDFLCFMIWPFIESYWLAAISLYTLAPSQSVTGPIWIDSKLFAARTQAMGKTLYYQGDLSYLEAVNKETLNNAFTRYQEQGIILRRRREVSISPDYVPVRMNGILIPRGHLWELVERIGTFRREGKNRRDNATVSTRVLRIADILTEENATTRKTPSKMNKNEILSFSLFIKNQIHALDNASSDKITFEFSNFSELQLALKTMESKHPDLTTTEEDLVDVSSTTNFRIPICVRMNIENSNLLDVLIDQATRHWCCIGFKVAPLSVDAIKDWRRAPRAIVYCVASITLVTMMNSSKSYNKQAAMAFYEEARNKMDDVLLDDIQIHLIQSYFCLSYTSNLLRLYEQQRTWGGLASIALQHLCRRVEPMQELGVLRCWFRWYYIDAWMCLAVNRDCLLPDRVPWMDIEQIQVLSQEDEVYRFACLAYYMRRYIHMLHSGKVFALARTPSREYYEVTEQFVAWYASLSQPHLHLHICYHSVRLLLLYQFLHSNTTPESVLMDCLETNLELLQALQRLKEMACDQSTYHHMFFAIHNTATRIYPHLKFKGIVEEQLRMNWSLLKGTQAYVHDVFKMKLYAQKIQDQLHQLNISVKNPQDCQTLVFKQGSFIPHKKIKKQQ
ncbi:hypothetical protein G6F52_007976 [Rhizopus delemar]|nr:hypothetical protein G6F52_007976 [Rhizopus delemar]